MFPFCKSLTLLKLSQLLLVLFVFLLPWQARYVHAPAYLNGGLWEYGSASVYATEVILWLAIILFMIDAIRRPAFWKVLKSKEHFKRHWMRLLYCLIVVLLFALEILLSVQPWVSYNFVFHLLEAGCLIVMFVTWFYSPQLKKESYCPQSSQGVTPPSIPPLIGKGGPTRLSKNSFLFALWLGGVMQGVLGLIQFFTQSVIHAPWSGIASHSAAQLGDFVIETATGRWLRAYGSFGSPNILGGFLVVCWLVGMMLYLQSLDGRLSSPPYQPPPLARSRIAAGGGVRGGLPTLGMRALPIVFTISQLIILSGLIVSFSRGAWIAWGVGVVMLLLFRTRAQNIEPLQVIGRQIALSLGIIFVFFMIFRPLFLTRTLSEGRLEAKSITDRESQYVVAWNMFKQHPWLGVGPGAYTFALYQQNHHLPVWQYQPAHNVYLLVLVEMGMVGFVGFMAFHGFIVPLLWRKNKIFLPILFSIFILGLFDHYPWSMYGGVVMWGVVIGLGIGTTQKIKQPS